MRDLAAPLLASVVAGSGELLLGTGNLLAQTAPIYPADPTAQKIAAISGLVFQLTAFVIALTGVPIALVRAWKWYSSKSEGGPPTVAPAVMVACLLIGSQLLSGCSATPARRAHLAHQTYTLILEQAVELRKAGRISDENAERFEVGRLAARSILNQLDAAAAAGKPIDKDALQVLERVLRDMSEALTETPPHAPRIDSGAAGSAGGAGPLGSASRPGSDP